MNITVAHDSATFETAAAWAIINQICSKPDSVIGLSTGRTTGNIHRLIARLHKELNFDVSRVTFFGLDEVMNVPREYAGACYTMLKTELMDSLGVKEENFLMLPTMSDDFQAACEEFRAELSKRGGIDLLMLGLGENGHLGFNQPGSPLGATAWCASMDERLEERIRRETATPDNVALGGVTLGIRDIMRARSLVLVANGANKRQAVKEMLCGPVDTRCPASVLQLHPHCEFLLDDASAADIDVDKLRTL